MYKSFKIRLETIYEIHKKNIDNKIGYAVFKKFLQIESENKVYNLNGCYIVSLKDNGLKLSVDEIKIYNNS